MVQDEEGGEEEQGLLKILGFIIRTVGLHQRALISRGVPWFYLPLLKIFRSLQLRVENGLEGDRRRSEEAPAKTRGAA